MRVGLLVLAAFAAAPTTAADLLPKDRQRVVFLGDSNTFAGHFIAYIEAYLITRFPERKIELINLGLPSETVSGLSEADHPYPRPNVHDRLATALAATKPHVVVACYGMNDGIYSPFDEARFKKYQHGMLKLIADCEKAGARVVLMTPDPFDARPLKDKVLPKGAEKYSWLRPYEKYDEEVLTKYSEWLLTLRAKGYAVADPHAAILRHLAQMRKKEPEYRVSGDGIHPNETGHLFVALELLAALKAPLNPPPGETPSTEPEEKSPFVLVSDSAWPTFLYTDRLDPPGDPKWDARLTNWTDATANSRVRIPKVPGEGGMKYDLIVSDKKVVTLSKKEWESGIDLRPHLPNAVGKVKRAAELFDLVSQKQKMMGLAWLTDVGHKRPDTPKGIPLAEAKSKAGELDLRIRKLAQPDFVSVGIVPAK